jgi:DNA polymerase
MRWLILDFETYYDKIFNLRKLIPPNYILDPRYETNMVAVQEGLNGTPTWVDGPDLAGYLSQFDPADTIVITFNALFDMCILAWRYGFVPALMIDVMGMARALRGHQLRSVSLESCAEHEGIGHKIPSILGRVIGMRRTEIMAQPDLWKEYCDYAMQDVYLTAELFKIYAKEFPKEEYEVMDLVLRCAVQPRLCIDHDMLAAHMDQVIAEKDAMLVAANTTKDDLMSPVGFQQALEALGVEVEYKTTPAGNSIPAFAKTDDFMEQLTNHEDPQVQALVAARLGHKSTLEETRGQRLLALARLDWTPVGCLGTLPFALPPLY